MKDKTGREIPSNIEADWRAAKEFQSTITVLQRIKDDIKAGVDHNALIYREIDHQAHIDIGNAIRSLKRVIPYALCPTCQGRTKENCTFCKGRGWLSKFLWDICATTEVKEIIRKATGQEPEPEEPERATTAAEKETHESGTTSSAQPTA